MNGPGAGPPSPATREVRRGSGTGALGTSIHEVIRTGHLIDDLRWDRAKAAVDKGTMVF